MDQQTVKATSLKRTEKGMQYDPSSLQFFRNPELDHRLPGDAQFAGCLVKTFDHQEEIDIDPPLFQTGTADFVLVAVFQNVLPASKFFVKFLCCYGLHKWPPHFYGHGEQK